MKARLRALTAREKNILRLALLLVVVLVLSNGIPALRAIHNERALAIETLRDEIAREQRLVEDTGQWQQRRQEIDEILGNLDAQLFFGSGVARNGEPGARPTAPMLTANIQRLVRQYAAEAGVTITSTRLAESREADGWLLVEQSLSFNLDDQAKTLDFLSRLDASEPWLGVKYFSMRRNRNMYAGDITVVGFARLDDSGSGGN